jgi:hypothetical protein
VATMHCIGNEINVNIGAGLTYLRVFSYSMEMHDIVVGTTVSGCYRQGGHSCIRGMAIKRGSMNCTIV